MENKNQELQRQEFSLLKTSEVEKFNCARAAKKIKDADEEEIRQALRYAMVKIGLRAANFPTGIEKTLLIHHVIENFPDNTVDEIRICFDWAISGRIEEDFNCYENFSCAYFSKMMLAYNLLANSVKPDHEVVFAKLEDKRTPDKKFDEFIETDFAKRLVKSGVEIPKF
jgi:hypothetical protein